MFEGGTGGRLKDKVAIVTGGARGIGAETVRAFVRERAKVVIADMLADAGDALAGELGEAVLFTATDVSREAAWAALLEAATTRFGAPDILVNNAAVAAVQVDFGMRGGRLPWRA